MSQPSKSKNQRPGRPKKAKPLTDKAWVSLFRYNARALRLRDISSNILMGLVEKYGDGWIKGPKPINDPDFLLKSNDLMLFTEYWYSSLEIVVETYDKYVLEDEDINKLLDMPFREQLKKFRNDSFHFREDYDAANSLAVLNNEGAFNWVISLQKAFLIFFEKEEQNLKERSGVIVRKIPLRYR